jgi:hypothetical protein
MTETAKLAASDAVAGDEFGVSVAVSGDTVVVGATPYSVVPGPKQQGYVFVKPVSGWSGTMTETAKLTAADAAADDRFGYSVGVSGGLAVVGAVRHEGPAGGQQGSAYVFDLSDRANPVELAKFTASDAAAGDTAFGVSVALDGDLAVVGAQSYDLPGGVDQGAAYVFGLGGLLPPVDCNGNGVADECDSDIDGDGIPNDCDPCPFDPTNTKVDGRCIPTLSEWGMMAMAALMLSAGGVVIVRRQKALGTSMTALFSLKILRKSIR